MPLTDEQFIKALKALSEPNRLEILRLVQENACDEGVKCAIVLNGMGISQSTLSHHVSELREAEILIGVPDGRAVKLSVNEPLLKELQEKIGHLF